MLIVAASPHSLQLPFTIYFLRNTFARLGCQRLRLEIIFPRAQLSQLSDQFDLPKISSAPGTNQQVKLQHQTGTEIQPPIKRLGYQWDHLPAGM